MIVGQGPTVLTAGVGGGRGVWIFFYHQSFLFSFCLSLGDGLIQTEILSLKDFKPQTTDYHNYSHVKILWVLRCYCTPL